MTLQCYHSLRRDSSGATARFPYIPLKKAICIQFFKKIFTGGWRVSCTLPLRKPKRSVARFQYQEFNIIIVTTTTIATTAQSFHLVLVATGMRNHTWAIFQMQRATQTPEVILLFERLHQQRDKQNAAFHRDSECCVSDSWTHEPSQLPNPFLLV